MFSQGTENRWTAKQVLTTLQSPVIQFASPPVPQSPPLPIPLVSSRPPVLILDLPHNIKLEMIKIPAGSFFMGSADNNSRASKYEKPRHQVTLQEYYLGKYPVTQEQYQAVMGYNPSHFKDNPKNPVESINWNDTKTFCQTVYEIIGQKVRLPTEAEWEYGCRAGTTTPFYFGETISTEQANYNGNYTFGEGKKGTYREKTTPVGSFPANKFGLYDMHGNVWEWCEESWHDNYAEKPEKLKQNGNIIWSSSNESLHVLRGGSWLHYPEHCLSVKRSNSENIFVFSQTVGFRLALSFFQAPF